MTLKRLEIVYKTFKYTSKHLRPLNRKIKRLLNIIINPVILNSNKTYSEHYGVIITCVIHTSHN